MWIGMWHYTVGLIVTLALSILMAPLAAEAQPPAKVPRIAILSLGSPAAAPPALEAFQDGLRKLGWIEGQNIAIEYRWAAGKVERLPALAAELVRLNVDLFVTPGEAATRAAWQATRTIPIVMVFVSDPVGVGLVASLARPGGTITGISSLSAELSGKNLELLKELLPGVTQVTVLTNPARTAPVSAMERAAQVLGVQLRWLDVRAPEAVDTAFSTIASERASALLVLADPMFYSQRRRIAELAARHRLPAMYQRREHVDAGGLIAYGASRADLFRRAATYVDKILKGANPGDIPVEQPTKFELVINLKTAKALGLTIPPTVLFQADEVLQ